MTAIIDGVTVVGTPDEINELIRLRSLDTGQKNNSSTITPHPSGEPAIRYYSQTWA